MRLDSRQEISHYAVEVWPPRENPQIRPYNVKHQSLVDPNNVYLPALHIKLGFVKNFVKAMDLHREGSKYLQDLFEAEKLHTVKSWCFCSS